MAVATRSRITPWRSHPVPVAERRRAGPAAQIEPTLRWTWERTIAGCWSPNARRPAACALSIPSRRSLRLGEGLAATGQLSDAAMQRAIDALRKCSDKVKKHRPVQSRYIATQACRAASNGRAFVSEVRRTVGLQMETISPKEEAKFALLGSLDLVDPAYDFALVIDIGGGSTELCVDRREVGDRARREGMRHASAHSRLGVLPGRRRHAEREHRRR